MRDGARTCSGPIVLGFPAGRRDRRAESPRISSSPAARIMPSETRPGHLPRREVGDDDHLLADERVGLVRLRDARDDRARLAPRRGRPWRWSSLSFFGTAAADSTLPTRSSTFAKSSNVIVAATAGAAGRGGGRGGAGAGVAASPTDLREDLCLHLVVEAREQRGDRRLDDQLLPAPGRARGHRGRRATRSARVVAEPARARSSTWSAAPA